MFPKIDNEIIEFALRGNVGDIDKTVDYLLSMEIVNEEQKINNQHDKISAKEKHRTDVILNDAPPSYHDLPQSIRDGYLQRSSSFRLENNQTNNSTDIESFKIPIKSLLSSAFIGKLPHDFLRVPSTSCYAHAPNPNVCRFLIK
jgi:hypothetical protein